MATEQSVRRWLTEFSDDELEVLDQALALSKLKDERLDELWDQIYAAQKLLREERAFREQNV